MIAKPVYSTKGFLYGLVALSFLWAQASTAADDGFPGRAIFVATTPIELQALKDKFEEVTLVDVRSEYEYETLHIKSAELLPLYDANFDEKVRALRSEGGKPLVFYCNGRSCYKSYKAADKARVAGVRDVEVYDAGMMEWAQAFPQLTVLLGEELKDTSRLLSKADFKKRLLSPKAFGDRVAADPAPMLLDIRSLKQRRSTGLFIFKERHIPLEKTSQLDRFVDEAIKANKPVMVYDMAGKQVQWFQYYLESKGVKEYYFMEGGVRAFFDDEKKKKKG